MKRSSFNKNTLYKSEPVRNMMPFIRKKHFKCMLLAKLLTFRLLLQEV
jgi:hypothetical protein